MDAVEQLLLPVLEVQSALVGTDGPTARDAAEGRRASASADGGARHEALAHEGDRQVDRAGGGYDSPSITEVDNWHSWDLEELHGMLDGISVEAIEATGAAWQALGRSISEGFDTFRSEVSAAVAEKWTGRAAAAANDHSNAFAEWGTSFGAAVDGTGTRIRQAASAVELTKINMPDPQDFNWQRMLVVAGEGALVGGLAGAVVGGLTGGPAGMAAGAAIGAAAGGAVGGGGDVVKQFVEHQQAQQRAAEVMDRYYSGGYVDVDSTTPAFLAAGVGEVRAGGGSTSAASATGAPTATGVDPLLARGSGSGVGGATGLGGRGGASGTDGGNVLRGLSGSPAPGFPAGRGNAGGARGGTGPVGAGGARGKGEEDEERLTKYVKKEDSGIFTPDVPYAKPVIGG